MYAGVLKAYHLYAGVLKAYQLYANQSLRLYAGILKAKRRTIIELEGAHELLLHEGRCVVLHGGPIHGCISVADSGVPIVVWTPMSK